MQISPFLSKYFRNWSTVPKFCSLIYNDNSYGIVVLLPHEISVFNPPSQNTTEPLVMLWDEPFLFPLDTVLCYVVWSRRLMPPDALQSKAYCTNPGL